MGFEGAKALAESLRNNTSLQYINLAGIYIGDEGVIAILGDYGPLQL